MPSRRMRTVAILAALCLCGAASGADGKRPDGPRRGEKRAAAPITAALDKRIQGKASPDDVRIDLVWERERSQIFGTGVVVWDHAVQCSLPRADVVSILKEVNRERFGSMPTRLGSGEEEEEKEKEKPIRRVEKSPLKGMLTVAVGPLEKTVLQLRGGQQSKPLADLAAAILRVGSPCEKTGAHPEGLLDGLTRIAAGKLAPETLTILVQRKIEQPAEDAAEIGWMLQMTGPQVTGRVLHKDRAPDHVRWIMLPATELAELVALLSESDPGKLPQSLYAPDYTDLRIRILGANRYINARKFSGMTPTTHGAKQESFDRLYERFHRLFEQVQKDGKPVSEELPTAGAKENDDEKKEGKKEEERERSQPVFPGRTVKTSPMTAVPMSIQRAASHTSRIERSFADDTAGIAPSGDS